ncbi:MAG: LysE family transporter [Bacteroidia bacterium]|nr:LysE family transporter [Bacteroidia bacterium]
MEIVLNGVKFGVVLALLIGPVFFTIIQVSIERGFWSGVMVTLGTSLSDTIYVAICYFGLVQLIDDPQFRMWMAYVGGTIMIVFGLYHLLVKSRKNVSNTLKVEENKPFYRYFIKGFIINGLSPSVFVFWVGTTSLATLSFGYSKASQFIIFFAALLGTVLVTDILKAYLAGKLRTLVTHHFLMILNIGLGAALIILGARLIFLAKTITFN